METIGARVVGFDTTGSFTTYTTEVTLTGAADPSWLLAIRYSTFATAHAKLVALDSDFHFDFPPKGGFFSSPSPKEREPKLDEFLQRALEHLALRKFPQDLCEVMEDLLDVKENLTRLREPESESEMENDDACCGKCNGATAEENNQTQEPAQTEVTTATETVAVQVEEKEATVVETVVETIVEEEQAVKVETAAVTEVEVEATATATIEETTTTTTSTTTTTVVDSDSVKTKATTATTKQAALEVASITTTTTASGVEVQHVQFANGMSLKKKTLTAEQKRLRNMRRKEKRKKKGGVKIRGARSASQCVDGASTEEDE